MNPLARLLRIFRLFTGEILLSLFLGVAAIGAGIGLLGTSAYIIASAALHPSIAELQVAIVGVRFFGISRGVFRYLERLVSHSVNLRVVSMLREDFIRRVEPGAPANLAPRRGGDLLQRVMGDLQVLENFYVRVVAPVVVAFVIITGTSLFIGRYALELGVILFSGMVITGFLLPVVSLLVTRKPSQRVTAASVEISASLVVVLQGLEDIQSNNARKRFYEDLEYQFEQAGREQNTLGLWSGLNNGVSLFLTNLIILTLLWVAIPMVHTGDLTGITLAVITLMALASFEAIMPLNTAAQTFNASRASANRFFSPGEEEPGENPVKQSQHAESENAVKFEHVTLAYPDEGEPALRDINFEMQPGRRIAIVGASGAGKTSLLNLLLGFHQPSQGRISFGAHENHQLDPEFLRSRFSVLSQKFHIFNEDVRQNLLLANPDAADEDLIAAIKQAGLSPWLAAQPDGLDTWIGEGGVKMSGGEKQRLALARVFLQDRPYVVLDEPTANLDRVTAEETMQNVFSWSAGRGMLLITHDPNWLTDMDEILVLKDGIFVERGKLEQLQAQKGPFAALYAAELDILPEM